MLWWGTGAGLSHLSASPICWDFFKKRSTSNVSVLPFLAAFICSSLWLFYSIFTRDSTLQVVNSVAAFLQLSYVFCFYVNTSFKKTTFQKVFTTFACLIISYLYSFHVVEAEKGKALMGYLASMGSILASAAPLASVSDVIKSQSSESLPFPIIFSTFIVQALWCIYGILVHDMFIQVPNLIGALISFILLSLFFIYPASSKKDL
nr:sugar transporter SWEET1 isoform X2 [Parasteatoda tepidariorum]